VGSMFWRRWARKDLIAGDLASLLDLTRDGRWSDPNPNRLRRLRRRGFIDGDGAALRVTMKGRVALLLGRRS
jgi:hypothetical protein